MSIDNICLLNVSTDHYVCNQNYPPVKHTESSNSVFQDLLEDKVNQVDSSYTSYTAIAASESEDTNSTGIYGSRF